MKLDRQTKYERGSHGRILFSELADAVLADYKMNKKKSLDDTERRIKKHLLPFFGNRRAGSISTDDFLKYIAMRQKAGASNGTINWEFTILKRAFALGAKSTPPKILRIPSCRHGQSLGKVEPDLASSDVQTDRNLLESQHGPVAQKDRAAVS